MHKRRGGSLRVVCLALLCAVVLVMLTGCSYNQTGIDAMLKPPKLSDQQNEIYAALTASVDKGSIRLKYPRKGKFTSAFLVNNLDDEPSQEALVFYELTGSAAGTMSLRINVLDQQNGKWVSMQDIGAGAGTSEVEKVSFVTVEQKIYVIIGFNLASTTEKSVAMYSYENGTLNEKFRTNCSNYEVIDLNNDGSSEIVTLTQKKNEAGNTTVTAELRRITTYGESQILSVAQMDPNVTEYKYITVGQLGDGRNALFLDGLRGTSVYMPEILACDSNQQIENLMYDGNTMQYLEGVDQWTFDAPSIDLNGDGVVEIPVKVPAPGYENTEKHQQEFFTEWYTYEDEALKLQKTTYVAPKGYIFTIPESWIGKVTVQYVSNDDELVIYRYEEGKPPEQRLVAIKIVKRVNYEREANRKGYTLLRDNGQILYTYQIYENSGGLSITPEQVVNGFQIYKL